jgi:hypothetical protein
MDAGWIAAIATTIIAAIVALITHRQYTVSRDQMRLALFEKRLEIYEQIYKFLSDIQGLGHVEISMFTGFYDAFHKSFFLFGDDIKRYLIEIRNHALEQRTHHVTAKDCRDDQERLHHIKRASEEFRWLCNEIDALHKKFGRYLNFHDKYNW